MAADQRIAGYAAAIFEIARAEGQLEQVEDELFRIARAVEGSIELQEALSDQRLPLDRKKAILEELIGGKVSPLTASFVNFIVSLGRGRELPEIVDGFVSKAAQERNRVVAEVRSAIELDEETVRKLEEALSRATGKQVEAKVVVDPEVIGGVVAKVGDVVIDGSVRRRLEELRELLGVAKE